MIVTFYFFISWLLLVLFIFNRIQKQATINEITLLLLLSCLVNTHTYAGLFDTLKFMKFSTDIPHFIALLLFKNIFVPLLITCFTLLIDRNKRKIRFFSLFILIILLMDSINVISGMYTYKQWNLFCTFIYYSILLFLLLFTLKWFRKLDKISGGENRAVD
ncbi:hypothetical protein [Neobacillus niacini]|uniref:hypothetical protein n=1 Tax=Neobacillus niacini TaxID=86668 RepID=UPI003983CAFA